jgi:uncharacterized protein (DUF2141 family)
MNSPKIYRLPIQGLLLSCLPASGSAQGLSNNPQAFGPAKFADGALAVGGAETSVNISMSY